MTGQRRQPKGVPVGGQFSTSAHDESKVLLNGEPWDLITESVRGKTLIDDEVRIDLGESCGFYDDDHPYDPEMLSFTVYRASGGPFERGWGEVREASWCTGVPVSTSDDDRQVLLESMMSDCGKLIRDNHRGGIGDLLDTWTRLGPDDIGRIKGGIAGHRPPSAEDIAFRPENINAWNSLDDAPGEIIEEPSSLQPGSIIAVRGHGYIRTAVVTGTGKKNAKAVFTTPGARDVALKVCARHIAQHDQVDKLAAEAAERARRDWDFYTTRLNPEDPTYHRFAHIKPADIERGIAEAKETLASWGSREQCGDRAAAKQRERIEESYDKARTTGLQEFTVFTNATVKPGQAKLISAPEKTP